MNHGHQFDAALSAERKAEQERKQAERETRKKLEAAAPNLLAALKFVQTALANWRDEEDIIHPEHGILNLEEVKYLVVDMVLERM